jgi:vitamin B12 transporter
MSNRFVEVRQRPNALLAATGLCCIVNVGAVRAEPNMPQPRLNEIVVTATRAEESLDDTLASVTVITRADIERLQAQSTQDLLSQTAGVSVANNGGQGKITTLFIRGAEADQNLILVDGVRVGSTTAGIASLQDLPLDQIERIEIVRGPRSALYGADALGGVVQLFTRKPTRGSGWQPELSIGGGSHGTQRAAASFGGATERAFFRLGINHLETEGTNSCAGFGAPIFAGCFTDEPDRDGYRNTSASLRGGVTLATATELELFALYSEGRAEYDGSFGNVADLEQRTVGASLRQPLRGSWSLRAQLGQATDDTNNFAEGTSVSFFDTTRTSASVLLDGSLTASTTLTAGVDYIDDRVTSDTEYVESARYTVGAFAQARWAAGQQEWLLSTRFDDNEQFGSEVTGSLAWGMELNPRWRVTASGGTAFKAPTFNELYFPNFGNPALQPETSRAIEASLRYALGTTRAMVTVYENRIEDLIGFDSNFAPVNIDATRIRGVEAEAKLRWRTTDIAALVEWLDPENRSGSFAGNVLPRRARERARLEISTPAGPTRFGVVGQFSGERFDNIANTRRLGSYATLDLLGEWRVRADLLLQARLSNALDRDYATAAFYPQPGREWFVTIRFTP